MTTDTVLSALLRAPRKPSTPAMESAAKILQSALDGYFPDPDVAITQEGNIELEWNTMTCKLVILVHRNGGAEYDMELLRHVPFGMLTNVHRKTESGDVTDLTEGTQNLLIWLLADGTAQA